MVDSDSKVAFNIGLYTLKLFPIFNRQHHLAAYTKRKALVYCLCWPMNVVMWTFV